MAVFTLALLKTELTTDPRGYGYNAAGRNDSDIQSRINALRDGTNPGSNPTAGGGAANGIIQVKRQSISRLELMNAIDTRDLKASPTILEGSWLESVLQADEIELLNADGTNNLIRQNLNRLLNDTNGSQTRFGALAKRVASRAEELWGRNVTLDEVGTALNLPG